MRRVASAFIGTVQRLGEYGYKATLSRSSILTGRLITGRQLYRYNIRISLGGVMEASGLLRSIYWLKSDTVETTAVFGGCSIHVGPERVQYIVGWQNES